VARITRRFKTETVIIIRPRIMIDDAKNDGVRSPLLKEDVADFRVNMKPEPFVESRTSIPQ
jgi:hypothetical protein